MCTFYGTANSNLMMLEMMGLQMPGSAFVNPGTPLRQALTRASVHRLAEITRDGNDYRPLAECVDERAALTTARSICPPSPARRADGARGWSSRRWRAGRPRR